MELSGTRYIFNSDNVDWAPEEAGVFALFDDEAVIYYGHAQGGAVTIRSRLQDHLSGKEGRCTQAAVSYMREVTPTPAERERELVEDYLRTFGRLPRCNASSA